MSEVHKKFELYLARAEKSVKGVAINYRKAADIAIQQFADHGDLSLCQRVVNSMNDKTRSGVVKRSGFLTWLMAFSPAIIDATDKKKLVKDKSDNAVQFNVAAALATDFWTMSANNDEELLFASDDIYKAIMGIYRRFSKENAKATDEKATGALHQVESFIKKHSPGLLVA